MNFFVAELRSRNPLLYQYGLTCFAFAAFFLVLTQISEIEVMGANAWYKPFKFALSTFFYSWAMAWYGHYLHKRPGFNRSFMNWTIISLLSFEIIYIALQASRGQLSHYNTSTPLYSFLYALMALAATLVTLYTAYVGCLFCIRKFPDLPNHYLWAIRCSIFLFVIFSLEGFVMGSRLTHTIGGPDGGPGIPILNWSTKYGDPRVAHFIGMHALQVIPLVSFYILKSLASTIGFVALYGLLAVYTLMQALGGIPFSKAL